MTITTFTGFPPGKNPYVPVPEVFFTKVLPDIEDSAELKVTLHIFWLLAQKQGNPRCTSDRELQSDQLLLRSLKRRGDPRPVEERLRQGLEQAVARGTLLHINLRLVSEGNDQGERINWYFFNTSRSRKVVAELQGGEMVPVRLLSKETEEPGNRAETTGHTGIAESVQTAPTAPPVVVGEHATRAGHSAGHSVERTYKNNLERRGKRGNGNSEPAEVVRNIQIQVERPNIFTLYEQNIGLLSPLIADELKDAADHYPADWIEAAFRAAVQHNKRKWSYIHAILRRWETEGRQAWNA